MASQGETANGSGARGEGPVVRKVIVTDKTQVAEIVKDLFGGNDYVNGLFDSWVSKGAFYGVEEYPGGPLVAFANIRKTSCGGYIEGVRSDPRYQRRGFGAKLLHYMLENSDVEELRYQTFTANVASIGLALRSGFNEIARFRYGLVTDPRFATEPFVSGFPGLDVEGYKLRMEETFGAVSVELKEERSAEAVVKALKDIRSEQTLIFQSFYCYDPEEAPAVFEEKGLVAMISPAMVSIGRFDPSFDPLGRLLTFTMYLGTRYEPTRDELWAHAAHWIRLGAAQGNEAICVHSTPAPPSLEADLEALMGPDRELIIFNKMRAAKTPSEEAA